ncbi:RBPJ-interacting and tubulin-associated protein 1 [Erinaceus europaeus]|uniref:RBPJ-interacting and tubulin-associated protein 1 n=1 Tax=Erinaceus europaeus TaxID=9365 RepID=A0A1S3A3S8_ERIEU|nr:RBPJ-interacting and tubulin-associated protein 1 [Erinaceus europaeus]
MKPPVEVAMSGMQALHLRQRCRGTCRLKAKASYVDETLFGSPAGTRPTPPDFDPPWVERATTTQGAGPEAAQACGNVKTTSQGGTPLLTPRKKNKYRLLGHTPSYCDESLFGSRPAGSPWEAPWMAKGDTAKLHTLFWTPPTTPRGSRPLRPRETPLRAVHPEGPRMTEPAVHQGSTDSARPARRGRSHSLDHLRVPSTNRLPPSTPLTNGAPGTRPSTSGVTTRGLSATPRARSASISAQATPRRGGATPKPKPPWR